MKYLSYIISALFFGIGLELSGMTNPQNIIGFLDITSKNWNPTLLLVLSSAVIVNFVMFKLTMKKNKPLYAEKFKVPTNKTIDNNLVIGAILFGTGWGISGFCPGPAIIGASSFKIEQFTVLVSMLMGMGFYQLFFVNKIKFFSNKQTNI